MMCCRESLVTDGRRTEVKWTLNEGRTKVGMKSNGRQMEKVGQQNDKMTERRTTGHRTIVGRKSNERQTEVYGW